MWRTALLLLLTSTVTASASAAPRIKVEGGFGPGRKCAFYDDAVRVIGRGFEPGRKVRVGSARIRAGARGGFARWLGVPASRRAQRRVTVRVRQGRTTASARYWAVFKGADVPGWNNGARAKPGHAETARFGGFAFAAGRPLYVHYLFRGRQVFSQRVARLRGPCGAARFRLVQFPFAAAEGPYRVDFGVRPTVRRAGGGYRRVLVAPSPPPPPATPLFTVAGNGTVVPAPDGAPATASGLRPGADLAAVPDGGFLLTNQGRVRVVDSSGVLRTVAGTGRYGFSGDGGPAIAARVDPVAVAPLDSGGFVFAQCDEVSPTMFEAGRIRRVDASGTITTIAGSGSVGRVRDGTPARSARLSCPDALAVAPDGRVLISEGYRIWSLGGDGILHTIAGTGEFPLRGRGGPARQTAVSASGLAPLSDGSVLVADRFACRVYRLADDRLTVVAGGADGSRRDDDGALATDAGLCPNSIAPVPGGGFYVTDSGSDSAAGSEPRLRFVDAGGRITTVAGTGRYSSEPNTGEDLRGDGGPAVQAGLQRLTDVAVLPDGGVVFSEGNYEGRRPPGLVRYLPPRSGGRLAVGVRRDRDRVFATDGPAYTTVSLTAPADVEVTVRRGRTTIATITRSLPAGDTRIELPALAGVPHAVAVSARDAGGRVAADRAAVIPRGWLAEKLARTLATRLIFSAVDADSYSGSGLGACRRFAPGRVDCAVVPARRCAAELTVRLGADGHLRWGTYRCPQKRSPRLRKRMRQLRKGDLTCDIVDTSCPPPLFGRVADRWLVPWD